MVFTVLVMLYLALDFADPHMPGANSFDVDESVVVVQVQRDPAPAPPRLAVTPTPILHLALVRMTPPRPAQLVRRRVDHARISLHAVQRLPPDPSDSEAG